MPFNSPTSFARPIVASVWAPAFASISAITASPSWLASSPAFREFPKTPPSDGSPPLAEELVLCPARRLGRQRKHFRFHDSGTFPSIRAESNSQSRQTVPPPDDSRIPAIHADAKRKPTCRAFAKERKGDEHAPPSGQSSEPRVDRTGKAKAMPRLRRLDAVGKARRHSATPCAMAAMVPEADGSDPTS